MEYPTDLRLTDEMDIYIDATGDIATISGFEQLEQSVAIDVLDILRDFIGQGLTGRNIGLLEANVQESLANDEQLAEVQNVTVDTYNKESGEITLDVFVIRDDDFALSLSA